MLNTQDWGLAFKGSESTSPFPPLMSFNFQDPPTELLLADARRSLSATRSSVSELNARIETAEAALAQVVAESKSIIHEMQNERSMLEEKVSKTMAYISPIRRLPTELLRDIFLWSFEDHPCCAWVLASVNWSWRRLALRMPRIWSKVCTQFTSPSFAIRVSSRHRLWARLVS